MQASACTSVLQVANGDRIPLSYSRFIYPTKSQASIQPEMGETSKKWKNPIEKFLKDEMGEEMSRLSKDVVLEILSRLSIKDLKQCMWVSKSWISMPVIQTSVMISTWWSMNFLVTVTACGVVPLRTKFKEMNTECEFVGSSNGLICFAEPSISDPVYVCSPVIGEYMTLPLTTEHPDIDIISGFGFDATTGKFKVFRMVYLSAEHTDDELWYDLEAEIYTWAVRIGGILDMCHAHLVVISLLCPEEPYGIVCFDLASEEFSIRPPPYGYGCDEIDTKTEDGRPFEIRVLKGQLCYFDGRGNQVVAWVMKHYGVKQSWTRGFSSCDLFNDLQVLNLIEGLPTQYEAFIHVPSLVSNRYSEDHQAVGRVLQLGAVVRKSVCYSIASVPPYCASTTLSSEAQNVVICICSSAVIKGFPG